MTNNKMTHFGCVALACLLLVVVFQWGENTRNEEFSIANRRRLITAKITSLVQAKPVYIHNLDEDTAKVTCLSPALINLEYKSNTEIQSVREKLLSALMKGTVTLVGKDLQKCGTTLERGVRRLEFSALSVNVITTDAADSPREPEKKITRRRLGHQTWSNSTRINGTNGTNGTNSSTVIVFTTRLNCQGNQTFPYFYAGYKYGTVVYKFTTSFTGYLRVSVRGAYGYAPLYVNVSVRTSLTSSPDYSSCGGGVCQQRHNATFDQTFALGAALSTPSNSPFSTGSTRLRGMTQYLFLVTAPKWWFGWIRLRLQCCLDPGCTGNVGTSTVPPGTTTQPGGSGGTTSTASPPGSTTTTVNPQSTTTTATTTTAKPGTTVKPGTTTNPPRTTVASFAIRAEFMPASLFLLVTAFVV